MQANIDIRLVPRDKKFTVLAVPPCRNDAKKVISYTYNYRNLHHTHMQAQLGYRSKKNWLFTKL